MASNIQFTDKDGMTFAQLFGHLAHLNIDHVRGRASNNTVALVIGEAEDALDANVTGIYFDADTGFVTLAVTLVPDADEELEARETLDDKLDEIEELTGQNPYLGLRSHGVYVFRDGSVVGQDAALAHVDKLLKAARESKNSKSDDDK